MFRLVMQQQSAVSIEGPHAPVKRHGFLLYFYLCGRHVGFHWSCALGSDRGFSMR